MNYLVSGNAVPTVKITLGMPFPGVPAGNDPCLQAFSRYSKISRSRPWHFGVTWRHRSRDDSIPHMQFPIGPLLEPSLYLQAFSRYSASNISVTTHDLDKMERKFDKIWHLMGSGGQGVQKFSIFSAKGTSLRESTSFEPFCMKIGSVQEKKSQRLS